FGPAYIVKKNKATSSLGNSFSYYSYEVGMATPKGVLYRFGSGPTFYNNMIINELQNAYKSNLERRL
ncbi:hypothetical protein CCZ01_10025, partial [Helicobacter monodelphidis]